LFEQPGGFAIKATLIYKNPWWRTREGPEDHIFAWLNGRGKGGFDWVLDSSIPGADSYALICFIAPELFDGLADDAEVQARAIADAMVVLTQDACAGDFLDCAVVDWRKQKYFEGGPNTNFEPGVLSACDEVWGRPAGNVHFAAAEYAASYTGYLEGAVASGREAAKAILNVSWRTKVQTLRHFLHRRRAS